MLHSQTTLILTALMFLALPVMVWLALRPTQDAAVNWWCSGSLLAGTGIVLMGLRPWLPSLMGYQLANICILSSMVLWAQALRILLGQPWSTWVVVFWLLLCALFYSALLAWSAPSTRGMAVRLALGGLALQTAFWAWRLARHLKSGNAVTIAANFLLLGLVLTGQGLWTARSIHPHSAFSNTWDASLLALIAMLTAMVAHFCYVGMVQERAAGERMKALLDQQAARQTQWLDAELHRLDRHRRMAILSGSLAHELNQPLTVAAMNAQLAERQWRADPSSLPMLLSLFERVEQGIDRTVEILQRIRKDKDVAAPSLRVLDLRQVLQQSLDQVEPYMRQQEVDLRLGCPPDPVPCLGDSVALSQVLVNLLRNAVQAMANGTSKVLSVDCRAEQNQILLRIRDDGPGLSADLSARWGEPLLSTKPDGLGMGLAISRDIVAQHQGELRLRNHPEGGVEALLCLPLLQVSS